MQSIVYHQTAGKSMHGYAVMIYSFYVADEMHAKAWWYTKPAVWIKKGAVSNAKLRAFEAALFLCIEAKIRKIKKKASKWGKKEYDEKRIGKILVFKSYTIPHRIGLRGVQSEQIQANSSFFRAVAKFFNI